MPHVTPGAHEPSVPPTGVVYHGTGAVFDAFDPARVRTLGFFFTADPAQASAHAAGGAVPHVRMARLRVRRPLAGAAPFTPSDASRLADALEAERPGAAPRAAVLDWLLGRKVGMLAAASWTDALVTLERRLPRHAGGPAAVAAVVAQLGHDGLDCGAGVVVVFDPALIGDPWDAPGGD